ncbi:MAG: LOG family protein, partial [Clostridia bacterium]|nr:LOG family protein [Clostridia bacterium]
CRHNKPIVVYNIKGYYNELNAMMQCSIEKNFIRKNCLELYQTTDDLQELFSLLENPTGKTLSVKELKDG